MTVRSLLDIVAALCLTSVGGEARRIKGYFLILRMNNYVTIRTFFLAIIHKLDPNAAGVN